MPLPTIDLNYVESLINSANDKIVQFNQKIKDIERKISELKYELDIVMAMIEYISTHDERKELVGLFYVSGEYGTEPKEDKDYLEMFEKRKIFLESSIAGYENQAQKRKNQIEFMKNDLVLLKKIKGINFLSRHRDALSINS